MTKQSFVMRIDSGCRALEFFSTSENVLKTMVFLRICKVQSDKNHGIFVRAFVKKETTVSWKILQDMLKEHIWSGPRFVVFLAAVSMIVSALSTAALTQWIKPVIDDIFIQHHADRLLYVSIVVFFIFFMRGLSEYSTHRCTDYLGERLVRSLQTRLFQHILGMNIDFFRENHEGRVMSLLTHDVRVLRMVMVQTMLGLLNRSLMVIFLAITMVKSSMTQIQRTCLQRGSCCKHAFNLFVAKLCLIQPCFIYNKAHLLS